VLGYDYPDSPVVVPDGKDRPAPALTRYSPSAHPGARLPHAWLPDGRSVFDLLDAGFTLLRLDAHADPGPFVQDAERAGVPVTVVDLASLPALATLYGASLVLVRPDQHVAWRGEATTDPVAVLTRVTGHSPAMPLSAR
jgi:hypothetical protein